MSVVRVVDVAADEVVATMTLIDGVVETDNHLARSLIESRRAGGDSSGAWTAEQAFEFYRQGWSNGYLKTTTGRDGRGVANHMPGKHDQSDHAGSTGGGHSGGDLEEAARTRQGAIDSGRLVGRASAELDQLGAYEARPEAYRSRITQMREEIRNIDPRSIDLSKVQRDFEQALDALLDQWVGITAYQREQIVDQVRSAVTSNDVAALARLSVSTTAAEQALVEAMTDMSLRAAERVVEEARAQGVRIDPVATDTAPFALTAAALAVLLAQGLTNSAGREALRRWSPSATGDDVSAAVREHLESLSDAFLSANLGGALSTAETAGRVETMMAFPDVSFYASEILDSATCEPCERVDGRWIGNSADPDIAAKIATLYPGGGYVDCEGGPRCRGQIVAVWRPERTATVEEVQ